MRRDRQGPDHAGAVVVLLDGGGGDAADADAVAAHPHRLELAVLGGEGGAEMAITISTTCDTTMKIISFPVRRDGYSMATPVK